MRISVVVCTFNGEQYILEQLESIYYQTRTPDEVLIMDDCSTDNTFQVVKRYIDEKKLLNWSVEKNKKNLGWKKNFSFALRKVSGDVIFCCDQDDIWNKYKIEKLTNIFKKDDSALLVASKITMVGEKRNKITRFLGAFPQCYDSKKVFHVEFNNEFFRSREPGCAIAIRSKIMCIYNKYWSERYPHDQLLWNIAISLDAAREIDESLILYRRVQSSVFESSSSKRSVYSRKNKLKNDRYVLDTIEKIIDNELCENKEKKKIILDRAKKWNELRIGLVVDKNIWNIFSLIKYIKFYKNKILYLVDIHDAILEIIDR